MGWHFYCGRSENNRHSDSGRCVDGCRSLFQMADVVRKRPSGGTHRQATAPYLVHRICLVYARVCVALHSVLWVYIARRLLAQPRCLFFTW